MEKAKVYFTDMRTGYGGLSLPQKLAKLIKAAGIGNIDFNKKFAAIKIHFGEPGNVSYLRPNYAKAVADVVKEFGGMPFLTDCNTLYVGRRKHALEHITAAYENGFSPFSTGCHVIIADGLKGTDEAYVPVPGGEVVKEAKIGKALMDADIIISLNHFKGHEAAGFGGAIKNIGMGGGSRAGKMEMHHDGKPQVDQSKCIGCHACERICAHSAPVIENKKPISTGTNALAAGAASAHAPWMPLIRRKQVPAWKCLTSAWPNMRGQFWQAGRIPYQPDCRRIALLRLPRRKRCAGCAGYRHAGFV